MIAERTEKSCIIMSSLFADVSKVIFHGPAFAVIAGGLGILANMICIDRDKLHVSPDRRATGIGAVSKITHHAVFQPAFKMDAVRLAVHPILYPLFQACVIV